ncbi:hypothetical protein EPUS_02939 [Endocarpon pusillum Z07020]|uniref:Uncharacterized protein n=1 Tax=Endocarpon pusillum (strain Z07020 / HMAS-L-300199) TaxID=1263415 RepID=U1GJ42_ENDPU|nr:uncharacterized protein EPUS_02939 [Endocarpon pusillum Z07020]ERF72148.1 hypothetical protein EPUS_02939 [Endocarpon pusillum Z07020]
MDFLQAEDQMDLASTPAVPLEDVDFELDDIREISAEPNQDIMVQDEPEHPLADSDLMQPSMSDHVDDDLMLDEDTITQQDVQADLPELQMDNHLDDGDQLDEDDDILYEDEEGLVEDGGTIEDLTKEQGMVEMGAGHPETTQEIQSFDNVKTKLQATADVGPYANEELRGAEETNNNLEEQQASPAGTIVDVSQDGNASTRPGSDILNQQPGLTFLEHNPNNGSEAQADIDFYDESTTNERNQAELEVNSSNVLSLEENTASSDESSAHAEASENLSHDAAHDSESRVYPNTSSTPKKDRVGSTLPDSLLHTVKVNYLGTEMCLFPPTEDDDSEMFFLEDQSLAQESLNKMLAACRDVLANTIGQDDELVLDVASLGLHISEDSSYAARLTLSQIIDVYIALAHNDNVTNIEPLSCSLSSRISLASQYAYLQAAANDGRTLTQILSENTFAPLEEREDGENERDGLGYQPAEIHREDVLAMSKGTDGVALENQQDSDLLNSQPDAIHESMNAGITSPAGVTRHESEIGPFEGNGDELGVNKNAESRDSVLHDKEQESSSATKRDIEDIKGDYDTSLDFCFGPGICSCSSCANKITDTTTSPFDNQNNEESTEDLFHSDGDAAKDFSLVESTSAVAQDDVEESDIGSNPQDTVSSRTVEAEDNQFEEDIFSQEGHTSGYDNSNLTANQADNVENFENFEVEEQDLDEPDFRIHSTHGRQPETGSKTNFGQPAAVSNLGVEDNVELPMQKREDNQGNIYAEADDKLLNFDDEQGDNRVKEEDRESSSSAYRFDASEHEAVPKRDALNGFTNSHDTTSANHNNPYRFEKDASSKALRHDRRQSSPGQSQINTKTGPQEAAPAIPSGGMNGSKRKALEEEDDDDFDLFDTTPDKKRRRPS